MKLKKRYSEQYLTDIIKQQLFTDENVSEEAASFPLEHLVFGYLKKENVDERQTNCILDVEEHGLLVVLFSGLKKDKILEHFYFRFADMQGIKIKDKKFSVYITLQFTNGMNYEFQLEKRKMKGFPNQNKNLSYVISMMEKQDLHNMSNRSYRKRVLYDKLFSFIYVITLVAFELLALRILFNFHQDSALFFTLIVIISIFVAVLHLIILFLAWIYIDKLINRKFYKAYNQIVEDHMEKNDAEEFLERLNNLPYKPKGKQAKNAFYISKSTALYENNRLEEALACLDEVQISTKQIYEFVEKQKKMIEGDGHHRD